MTQITTATFGPILPLYLARSFVPTEYGDMIFRCIASASDVDEAAVWAHSYFARRQFVSVCGIASCTAARRKNSLGRADRLQAPIVFIDLESDKGRIQLAGEVSVQALTRLVESVRVRNTRL